MLYITEIRHTGKIHLAVWQDINISIAVTEKICNEKSVK